MCKHSFAEMFFSKQEHASLSMENMLLGENNISEVFFKNMFVSKTWLLVTKETFSYHSARKCKIVNLNVNYLDHVYYRTPLTEYPPTLSADILFQGGPIIDMIQLFYTVTTFFDFSLEISY